MQPAFITLLNPELAGKYISSRYSFRWLYTESTGAPKRFLAQVESDIQRYESLNATISNSLGTDVALRGKASAKWASFLKPRVERLDSWSAALAALATLSAAGAALNATSASHVSYGLSVFFTAAGFMVSAVILLFRFGVDRQRLWYKYLIAHLEAIKSALASSDA